MENQDKELLQQAATEIESLRRRNEIMDARLGVFDSLMTLFHTPPFYPQMGMAPDVVSQIRNRIQFAEDDVDQDQRISQAKPRNQKYYPKDGE